MSRLVSRDVTINALLGLGVSPVRVATTTAATDTTLTDTNDYTTRIAKYIPAEVVAFYLAADKLFVKAPAAAGANIVERFVAEHAYWFAIGIFVLGLIGTPIYLSQQARNDDPVKVNAAVSTFAFAIWAYAVQGEIFAPVYSSAIASLAILLFTFVSGFIKPGNPA